MTSREKTYWQITTISGFFDFDGQIFGFLNNLGNWWYVKFCRKENPEIFFGLSIFEWDW